MASNGQKLNFSLESVIIFKDFTKIIEFLKAFKSYKNQFLHNSGQNINPKLLLDCRKYLLMRSSFQGAIISKSLYSPAKKERNYLRPKFQTLNFVTYFEDTLYT